MKIIISTIKGKEEIVFEHLLDIEFLFDDGTSLAVDPNPRDNYLDIRQNTGRVISILPRAANSVWVKESR